MTWLNFINAFIRHTKMENSSSSRHNSSSLIRPLVHKLHAYVPGEQPKIKGLIKLNTNENPYPPSPKVLAAVKAAVDGRLRLYPNPTAENLRAKLAKLHRCSPDNITDRYSPRSISDRGPHSIMFGQEDGFL